MTNTFQAGETVVLIHDVPCGDDGTAVFQTRGRQGRYVHESAKGHTVDMGGFGLFTVPKDWVQRPTGFVSRRALETALAVLEVAASEPGFSKARSERLREGRDEVRAALKG